MQQHPTMPALPPMPPERPTDRRRQLVLSAIALGACGAFFTAGFLTGVAVESDDKPDSDAASVTSVDPVEEPGYYEDSNPVEEPEPETEYTVPDASDFSIDLKVKSKKCFGSAGCNVEVGPELSYDGLSSELDPSAVYEITYEISGDESGPVIETLELTSQDDVSYSETLVSTTSSGVTPKAEITSVSAG